MIYECKGDPLDETAWVGTRLLDMDLSHGHTLDIGDIDGDGNLDILVAEQGKWTTKPTVLDNPSATARICTAMETGLFEPRCWIKVKAGMTAGSPILTGTGTWISCRTVCMECAPGGRVAK